MRLDLFARFFFNSSSHDYYFLFSFRSDLVQITQYLLHFFFWFCFVCSGVDSFMYFVAVVVVFFSVLLVKFTIKYNGEAKAKKQQRVNWTPSALFAFDCLLLWIEHSPIYPGIISSFYYLLLRWISSAFFSSSQRYFTQCFECWICE